MSLATQTLGHWATAPLVEDRRARAGVGVAAFVLATSFAAYVAVPLPFTPVPMTLQPLFFILAGVVLGPRLGAAAIGSYVALGAVGGPVFAGGHFGLPWLMGPTGGYLLAAPIAAFVAGSVAGRSLGPRLLLGLALGVLTLYVGGLSQLYVLSPRGLGVLLSEGVIPFLLGDLVKVLIAFLTVRLIRPTSLGRF